MSEVTKNSATEVGDDLTRQHGMQIFWDGQRFLAHFDTLEDLPFGEGATVIAAMSNLVVKVAVEALEDG